MASKSKRRYFLFSLLILSGVVLYTVYNLFFYELPESCRNRSFYEWKKGMVSDYGLSKEEKTYTLQIQSPLMSIDKIYRSMEGPMVSKEYFICQNPLSVLLSAYTPELIWITGYKVELTDEKGEKLSEDFMCHNNLNIGKRNRLPWKLKTLGTDTRLFTLTEGQTDVHLPEGFGIPLLSNQRCRIDFQVLNHNFSNINLKVHHNVTIYYKKDAECKKEVKALYQQSAFMTKQVSGPKGNFGEAPLDSAIVMKSNSYKMENLCCSNPGKFSANGYPFKDTYNRIFTGHWELADTTEMLTFDVTPMLNLKKNSLVHLVSIHVHPFCKKLELTDATESKILFSTVPVNFKDKIGLKSIPLFTSKSGIQLPVGHKYVLSSIYRKTRPEKHTAMATMFLYLEEDE